MSFASSFASAWRGFLDEGFHFRGLASRPEFWWKQAFVAAALMALMLAVAAMACLDAALSHRLPAAGVDAMTILGGLASMAILLVAGFLIAGVALPVLMRRARDAGIGARILTLAALAAQAAALAAGPVWLVGWTLPLLAAVTGCLPARCRNAGAGAGE